MTKTVDTDVLIVGSGPAGGSAAVFLSSYGVRNMMLTKYRWTANTPRSHITNQRTMEIMRDMGLEQQMIDLGVPNELMGDTVFCTSLAGEELGRLHTWGTHPARRADYRLASPCNHIDLPQTYFEPILLKAAAERGTRVRFDTEFLSVTQDEDGVTARVLDRVGGSEYEIRARYLLGADGGRSVIAEQLELPFGGQADIAGSMNIVFEADLSHLVARRPSVLYWVMQPGSDIGGIGMGLVRMVRPWHEWLIVWGYDINGPAPQVDDEQARQIARNLIGDESIEIKITSTSLWTNNRLYATRYSKGRVFCMGDAVHRHPPSNGLGSNTSVGDAYNLCWKLAHVLDGRAGPSLLASYESERPPIGRQIVTRANQSIEEFGPIFDALGLLDTADTEQLVANMAARKEIGPAAAEQRSKLRAAIELKNYEFNAHGVELGQRYGSSAVASDGSPEPEYTRDPELYYHATTWPGARLPHCWLEHEGQRVSSLDLVGDGRFTILTGIGGEAWIEAAGTVGAELGLELAAHQIGPGRAVLDTYDDWARVSEVRDEGCVLVRPDAHVAWRSVELAEDAPGELRRVLEQVLGKRPNEAAPSTGQDGTQPVASGSEAAV
jgi:2,4-dichlorophenol 6-monooxygenase